MDRLIARLDMTVLTGPQIVKQKTIRGRFDSGITLSCDYLRQKLLKMYPGKVKIMDYRLLI